MEPPPQNENQKSIGKLKHILTFIGELNWFISASIALLAFFLVKRYVIDTEQVNNHDMQATYYPGDALVVAKINDSYITNDVVYFEYPFRDSNGTKTFLFQRVFGLPGDSIALVNKKPSINGLLLEDTATIRHNYFIKSRSDLDSAFKLRNGLTEGGEISSEHDYSYSLTNSEAAALKKTRS
jgi:signal peptidase I